jgi:hypothetical protein
VTNTVRLVSDAGATLVQFTDDATQAILTGLDLGFPAVREATTPLSGQDGEFDVTQLVGSRAITAEVAFLPNQAAANLDTLRGLMHPGRRYWLNVQMDGWPAERMSECAGRRSRRPQRRFRGLRNSAGRLRRRSGRTPSFRR